MSKETSGVVDTIDCPTCEGCGSVSTNDPDLEILAQHVLLRETNTKLVEVLKAAVHALRSYQHGNIETELAEEIADECDDVLALVEQKEKTNVQGK